MTLTFTILAALYFALAFAVERGRGRNLDIIACDFRDQLIATRAELTDTQRELAHVQHLHATLLAENNTLVTDLMYTEKEAQHLRAYVRKHNDVTAGVVLLAGAAQARQLHIAKAELMP